VADTVCTESTLSNRRGVLTVLALATTASFALTGCGLVGAGGGRTVSTAAPEDPKQALTKSTAAMATGNYSFTITGGGETRRGEIHQPESSLLRMSDPTEQPSDIQVLAVGKDRYMKMTADLGKDVPSATEIAAMEKRGGEQAALAKQLKGMKVVFDGQQWLHVDPTKLKDATLFEGFDEQDTSGATVLVTQATTATRAGDVISGTIDATAVPADQLPLDSDELTALGAKAKSLPYAATLDAQGRLVNLALDIPANGKTAAYRYVTKISAYGTAMTSARPTGRDVVEMYKLFNEK
jgi:hypothetical protein